MQINTKNNVNFGILLIGDDVNKRLSDELYYKLYAHEGSRDVIDKLDEKSFDVFIHNERRAGKAKKLDIDIREIDNTARMKKPLSDPNNIVKITWSVSSTKGREQNLLSSNVSSKKLVKEFMQRELIDDFARKIERRLTQFYREYMKLNKGKIK